MPSVALLRMPVNPPARPPATSTDPQAPKSDAAGDLPSFDEALAAASKPAVVAPKVRSSVTEDRTTRRDKSTSQESEGATDEQASQASGSESHEESPVAQPGMAAGKKVEAKDAAPKQDHATATASGGGATVGGVGNAADATNVVAAANVVLVAPVVPSNAVKPQSNEGAGVVERAAPQAVPNLPSPSVTNGRVPEVPKANDGVEAKSEPNGETKSETRVETGVEANSQTKDETKGVEALKVAQPSPGAAEPSAEPTKTIDRHVARVHQQPSTPAALVNPANPTNPDRAPATAPAVTMASDAMSGREAGSAGSAVKSGGGGTAKLAIHSEAQPTGASPNGSSSTATTGPVASPPADVSTPVGPDPGTPEAAASHSTAAAPDAGAVPSVSAPTPLITVAPATIAGHVAGAVVAPAAQESPGADAQAMLDQVVMGLRGKLDAQNGKAEIRLDPPNLGTVRVSISLERGALTAQFQSSSDVVRDLLSSHLDKLKTVLEGQGVAVDKLAVTVPPPPATPTGESTVPQNAGANGQQSSGSAAHDGRSAGQYQQDSRSGQRRPMDAGTFAQLLGQSGKKQPLDLVA